MRLNRFETILHHIHFNDNMQIDRSDKLYKLRPVIDILIDRFRKHGGLDENISIGESMIPYYGKHYAKQYIRGKPIRFGFKNWALCTSSGYLVSFEMYTGKSQDNSDERGFGLGGVIVLKLLEKSEILPNKGYKIYFDNYVTTGHCPFPEKKYWKSQERGRYMEKFFQDIQSTDVKEVLAANENELAEEELVDVLENNNELNEEDDTAQEFVMGKSTTSLTLDKINKSLSSAHQLQDLVLGLDPALERSMKLNNLEGLLQPCKEVQK
ncbi:hypothetical protein HUJ05_012195 [Dendroctonus ponderosae]|nr:hypothetical protein HUJ05_012195 [Dendroctonus ponderosae]